jgi:DNA-binding MarR family transcriptional regulator
VERQPWLEHLVCQLTQLDLYVQERFSAVLAPLGIHPRHFGMLSLLVGQDGLAQHELCQLLTIHRNVMVGLVDDLEARGLVERRRSRADRRAHAVHLLPAGRKMHAQAEARLNEMETDMLAGLKADEAESLLALLHRVSERAGLTQEPHRGLTRSDNSS